MDVETSVTLLKQKNILFFGIFFNLALRPNYESYRSNFFNKLALKNWAMNMHFNPMPIL